MKQRIFISIASDATIGEDAKYFKWMLIRYLENQGFIVELFNAEHPLKGSSTSFSTWTFDTFRKVLCKCAGAIIVGLSRNNGNYLTEFNQIEGTEIVRSCIPFIVLSDEGISDRGIFYSGNGFFIHKIKNLRCTLTKDTTTDPKLSDLLNHLFIKMSQQKHVFVGYCGLSELLFKSLSELLNVNGITFINWRTDFKASSTILEQIEEAAQKTILGIFLFTNDDMKHDGQFLPRDNVLFEAGFFTHAKGKSKVLIIKEEGTKMPEDLAGLIYIDVKGNNNVNEVKDKILNVVIENV